MKYRTCADQIDEALACETKEQADAWMEREVRRYREEFGIGREIATKTILSNLGYMAGYYDHETARKVFALFGAKHPVFGSWDYHKTMTPEEWFEAGLRWAEKQP